MIPLEARKEQGRRSKKPSIPLILDFAKLIEANLGIRVYDTIFKPELKEYITILSGKYQVSLPAISYTALIDSKYNYLLEKRYMPEAGGEISAPKPEPAKQPDMVVAPKNPINSEKLPGVTERLAQLKATPFSLPESRPQLADLKEKIGTTENGEYTEKEKFYLENGWKAAIQEYGTEGYDLKDIAKKENLDSADIKKGIEDGTIKDPSAIRLYGEMKLEHDQQYYTKWELDHINEPGSQERAKTLIEATKRECLPLINGTTKDLLTYSNQEAELNATDAKQIEDDEQSAKYYTVASNWYAMAGRLAELQAKEKKNISDPEEPDTQQQEQPQN